MNCSSKTYPQFHRLSNNHPMPSDPGPLEPWIIPEQEWVLIPVTPSRYAATLNKLSFMALALYLANSHSSQAVR